MGVFKSQELIFEHENSLCWTIEGLYVNFAKNLNLGRWNEIAYKGVNFNPWSCDCIVGGLSVSGTHLEAKKYQDWPLRVHTSIMRKISTLAFELEIAYSGVLKC